eukprot:168916_1
MSTSAMSAERALAVNEHANLEFQGSQIYLAASFFFERNNYRGTASYCRKSADSERAHAMEFYDHLHSRDIEATALVIPAAETVGWNKPTDVFKSLLETEEKVARSIHQLRDGAKAVKDHALEVFLNKFVEEQVKEIDEMRAILEKATAYEAMPGLFYHLDKELS